MNDIGTIYHSPDGRIWYERFSIIMDKEIAIFFWIESPDEEWGISWTDTRNMPEDTEIYDAL